MNLHITSSMTIGEVQEKFNERFPFLKLEFYKPIRPGQINQARKPLPGSARIADAQRLAVSGDLELTTSLSVRQLEKFLQEYFTISAQVFRCSGKLWLQTTVTDFWTLEHQNTHGKEITESMYKKIGESPEDFDLLRDSDH